MMKQMIRMGVWMLAAAMISVTAADRIATVNIEKVFKEYYKSKIAEGAIKQQSEVFRKYLLELNDRLRTQEKEFEKARDNAQNIALSDEARRDAEVTAVEKSREVVAQRARIRSYVEERNEKMREFELTRRKEILSDIQAEIKRRATAERYDFVLDTSGKTTTDLPTVLVSPSNCDLTETVLAKLNSTATATEKKAK